MAKIDEPMFVAVPVKMLRELVKEACCPECPIMQLAAKMKVIDAPKGSKGEK